ncbi:head GIN domain-containing protein [Mucilaginibacter polytrichastri]|uniref:Putative auto-transporter adhesin head GIN domain-containing protein n=1 Tax=Mucilaginibacter polytrichastri TaxID=1302689 RepID=A0A1Q5ZUS2_9SPHI|nr:head GIN domain-containing protein [Mucilaginibacter polytrichastri]OKS85521.1 hypothetical protein RG47T_0967 [Mucilaginibacter polytrichastri]SFS37333.1 Putative auto-transporter adhesin, head GIN domain [Mucilaginibacter polytrichastri]
MKKILITSSFIAVLALTCVLQSCMNRCIQGSGNQKTETRQMGDFSKINIEGAFKVNLKQDSSMGVTVTADDNLLKYIKVGVSDGSLHIYAKKNFCASAAIIVNVGVRDLSAIEADGAVELQSEGRLNVKDLKLNLAGANKVTLDLSAANVSTDASGANELFISGQAAAYKVSLTGSSKLHAFDFVVGDYSIKTAGASHSEINVLKDLKINTMGASDVKYKGNPANIQNDKSGASKVTKVD